MAPSGRGIQIGGRFYSAAQVAAIRARNLAHPTPQMLAAAKSGGEAARA